MKQILLVGGGGHARVVIDALRSCKGWTIAGILDPALPKGASIDGVEVKGGDRDARVLFQKGIRTCVIAVGSVGNARVRQLLVRRISRIGFSFANVVHPSACLARSCVLGDGTFIGPRAVVNAHARIGSHCIVNSGAIVEHECVLGDFVHVAPGVTLSGGVSVGAAAHIGTGAAVIQGISIGEAAVVGAGSVVVSDIPAGSVAFGNPCTVRRRHAR